MSDTVTVQGVTMSSAAAECVTETGVDPAADVRRVWQQGEVEAEALLAECLDGADDDREQGWRDYVDAVKAAARLLAAE